METRSLFYFLMKKIQPKQFCDMGSLDGAESLLFRKVLINTNFYAFEANPENFQFMVQNEMLKTKNINVYDFAVSDKSDKCSFFIADENSDPTSLGCYGNSSLLIPDIERIPTLRTVKEEVEVDAIRIDEFLLKKESIINAALWIDVEGAAWQVLKGMENIKDDVCLINVEVEKEAKWKNQKTLSDVQSLMNKFGFSEIARKLPNGWRVGDFIFINDKYKKELSKIDIIICKLQAIIWFQLLIPIIRKLLPKKFYFIIKKKYMGWA